VVVEGWCCKREVVVVVSRERTRWVCLSVSVSVSVRTCVLYLSYLAPTKTMRCRNLERK
jgi:hypothetical protein